MNDEYVQFKGMSIPKDIKPIEPFKDLEDIQKSMKRPINSKNTLAISLNTTQFRPTEISIHTADIGATYTPDFDFTDLKEGDAWRKTCRLKFNLQRFKNIDYVRCDYFFHRMQVCESLTIFEEVHKMLKPNGKFIITVLDLYQVCKQVLDTRPRDLMKLYNIEKLLFSAGELTGLYYNRTIWTFERLCYYLEKANFVDIKKEPTDLEQNLKVLAIKKEVAEPDING